MKISNSDVFNKASQHFLQSQLAQKLQEKYREKPYHERNIARKRLILIISYLFNFISISTGFTFLYFGILWLIGQEMTFKHLAESGFLWFIAIISLCLLGALEALKRSFANEGFQKWFLYKKAAPLLPVLLLGLLSVGLSYSGAKMLVEELEGAPKGFVPLAEIDQYYQELIDNKKKALAEIIADPNNYNHKNKFLYKMIPVKRDIQRHLLDLEKQYITKRGKQEEANKGYTLKQEKQTTTLADKIALAQILVEALLLSALFWCERYDFISANEFANLNMLQVSFFNKDDDDKITIHAETSNNTTTSPSDSDRYPTNSQSTNQVHAILHNGERYTKRQVQSYINTYTKRVQDALAQKREDLLQSRSESLAYWQVRMKEFI